MGTDPLLASLRAAVTAAPEDVALRTHLAELLAVRGERVEAIREAGAVLAREPTNAVALKLIAGAGSSHETQKPPAKNADLSTATESRFAKPDDEAETLRRLSQELADIAPPMFAGTDENVDAAARDGSEHPPPLRLADVAGMEDVKARLDAAVLAPIRNPDLGRLYGRSLRGGLLLYGPPGCGKTFVSRALAGELGARFIAVSLADVLSAYVGENERNVRGLFDQARRLAPCVVFLDEVDAIGSKRGHLRGGALRGIVNQLLAEMDGIGSRDGVYVIGATNHPWDVDVALRRPGRFDRMVLVLPPDRAAREALFRHHLRERPIANIDVHALARATDGYSGADIAYVCECAAERALVDAARSGTVRLIEMHDVEAALGEVRPSIGAWLQTARNVAEFAGEGGVYDDLLEYLRSRRLA